MGKDNDRNLLFGVLAVQLRGVSPAQVMEGAAAWLVDSAVPLSQRLEKNGAISPDDRALLDRLIDEMVHVCGDASAALQSIPGAMEFGQTILTGRRPLAPDATQRMVTELPFDLRERPFSTLEEHPGRYSYISEYGKGGMGRVLLVHDQFLGREIALKELLLPREKTDSAGAPESPMRETTGMMARFLQEARITGQLEHPSIVPVYELGRRTDGTMYYTMKLVRGSTLSKAIREAGTLDKRLALLPNVVDLCHAIAYAHTRGVIHRDIKPSNAMIGEFGETVLLDWGLAKIKGTEDVYAEKLQDTLALLQVESTSKGIHTRTGDALGTPNYMPPEQAEGRILELDERSDVYSMGALLYEVLTGTPPFERDSVERVLAQVISSKPRDIAELEPDAPPELVAICVKAMAKRPDGRYPTMQAFRDEIIRFETGAFVQSYRYNPLETLVRYYKRHRLAMNFSLATAVVLLVMGLVSYVNIWQARDREFTQRVLAEEAREREAESRVQAEDEAYYAQVQLAQTHLLNGAYPQASEVLWATREDRRDWLWGHLLSRANPEVFFVDTAPDEVFLVLFSPDGSTLAGMGRPTPVLFWDGVSGEELGRAKGPQQHLHKIVFNKAGTQLAGVSEEGLVTVWRVPTGEMLHQWKAPSPGYDVAFDEESGQVFAGFQDGQVRSWRFGSDAENMRYQAGGPVFRMALQPGGGHFIAEAVNGETVVVARDTGHAVHALPGSRSEISPDGTLVAAVLPESQTIALYNIATGELVHQLAGHSLPVFFLRFDDTGTRLLSGSRDGTVRQWNVESGEEKQVYFAGDFPFDAFFSGDARYVITCRTDCEIRVFHADTGTPLTRCRPQGVAGTAVSLARDQVRLAIATSQAFVQVWDAFGEFGSAPVLGMARQQLGHHGAGGGTVHSPDGTLMAIQLEADSPFILLDTDSGEARLGLSLPGWSFIGDSMTGEHGGQMSLSNLGERAAAVVDSYHVLVIDTVARQVLTSLAAESEPFIGVELDAAGERLGVTGDGGGRLRVFDVDDGSLLLDLKPSSGRPESLAFSDDGALIASITHDGGLYVWDSRTGALIKALDGVPAGVNSLQFRPGGKELLISSREHFVRIWDTETWEQAHVLSGSGNRLQYARYSTDGRYLAAQTDESALQIWDTAMYRPLATYPEFRDMSFTGDPLRTLWLDARGVARYYKAYPWEREEPGDVAGVPWREEFEALRAAQRPAAFAPPQDATATHYLAIMSTERLARNLTAMAGQLKGSATVLQPPPLNPRTKDHAMKTWLRPGDEILAVGDTSVAGDGAAFSNGLLALAARLRAGEALGEIPVRIRRDGMERLVSVHALPVESHRKAVALPASAIIELLTLLHEDVQRQAVELRQLGETVITDFELGDLIDARAMAPLALNLPDRLVALEGRPWESPEEALAMLDELRRLLASGERLSMSMTIGRGEFQQLEVELTAVRTAR
jgi:serine/threonine protein kinase/WD40 repeat protein